MNKPHKKQTLNLNLQHIEEWPRAIKILVIAGTAFIIIFLGYFLGGSMQSKKIKRAQTYYKEQQRLYKRKYRKLVKLQEQEDILKALDMQYTLLRQTLPKKSEASRLTAAIQKAAQKANIHILSFKPQPPEKKEGLSISAIDIQAHASFHEAGHFISLIANLKPMVVLHTLSLEHGTDKTSQGRSELTLRIELYHPEKIPTKDSTS